MTLLPKHNGLQLAVLVEQERAKQTSEEEMLRLFGPEPYYWEIVVAPKYSQFHPEWTDSFGREYMIINETNLAVRLPIVKNIERSLTLPTEGKRLLLIEKGGGNMFPIVVISANMSRNRSSTGWIQYKHV